MSSLLVVYTAFLPHVCVSTPSITIKDLHVNNIKELFKQMKAFIITNVFQLQTFHIKVFLRITTFCMCKWQNKHVFLIHWMWIREHCYFTCCHSPKTRSKMEVVNFPQLILTRTQSTCSTCFSLLRTYST